VRDEACAQELRVGVDEEVELAEDGEPNVVGTDDQRVVLVVCGNYRVDKAVVVRDEVRDLGREVAAAVLDVMQLLVNHFEQRTIHLCLLAQTGARSPPFGTGPLPPPRRFLRLSIPLAPWSQVELLSRDGLPQKTTLAWFGKSRHKGH
jgi:hypothetical protein